MPAFPNLSRAEAGDLVAFLRTLRPGSTTGPRRVHAALVDGRPLDGVVLNESRGELQVLGDDRVVHLLREAAGGRYRRVTSQVEWPGYDGHSSGNRYSPIARITTANASRLVPKWVFTLPGTSQLQVTWWSSTCMRDGFQRSLCARRRQRAPDLELSSAARAGGRGGSRRQPRCRGRRPPLHDDRPRAPHAINRDRRPL
jgi:hypothetical protein